VTIWSTATLQNVVDQGSTSNKAISITSTARSTSTTTGALTVAGGVGVGGNVYTGGEIHITSGTASVFYMVYNSAAGAVDFVFG
jgi:septum formation inhibitor MinC